MDGENGTRKLNLEISGAIVDNPCTRWSLACNMLLFIIFSQVSYPRFQGGVGCGARELGRIV